MSQPPKLSEMTPEAKREAIATVCGWTEIKEEWHGLGGEPPTGESRRCVPDYLNDLNAMREAEKANITPQMEKAWIVCLSKVVHGKSPRKHTSNAMARATASQRADALLLLTRRAVL